VSGFTVRVLIIVSSMIEKAPGAGPGVPMSK